MLYPYIPPPPPPFPASCRDASHHRDAEVFDEVFAFDRCVSRLMEMQTEEYLTTPWLGEASLEDVTEFIVKG